MAFDDMTTALSPTGDDAPLIPVLAVVGVGLIGGSFAAALRAAGVAGRILGVGRDAVTIQRACDLGLIDQGASLEDALEQADMIMLAAPVGAIAWLLERMAPMLRPETVVTDAGSTKSDIVQAARRSLGNKLSQFVPGHPVAGAEQTGPRAARPDLYVNRNVVLTPLAETSRQALNQVTRAWQACGARVLTMDASTHDTVLASVSHVPHFLSSVFMWQVAMAQDADLRLSLAGSGFRDFTRIAAGSPEVWRDIFMSNRTAVLAELAEVRRALEHAEQALCDGDEQALEDFLERAALARRLWASRSGLE